MPSLCIRCVLPGNFPNIAFDEAGLCNFCRRHEAISGPPKPAGSSAAGAPEAPRDPEATREFFDFVNAQKGKQPIDAICCYSGGKDSTYMLKLMTQEWGLRVLAYTLDNGFITEQAKDNIRKVVETLEVDHVFYKPNAEFMRKMYVSSMLGELNKGRGNYKTRISDACLSCISLVNTYAAKLALQMKIPMVFCGFTPGQIPKAILKNSYKFYIETYESQKEHWKSLLGPDVESYFSIPADGSFDVYQLSPYLVVDAPETLILEEIRKLGWVYPEKLDGCSSNCALNAVGNLCHEKRYGFHPYASELSQLIREGLLSRDEALEKLRKDVPREELDRTLGALGLTFAEVQAQLGRGV